jgi:DNA-binding NarL/FixJ family response regulator
MSKKRRTKDSCQNAPEDPAQQASGERIRVLIVDDHELLRDGLRMMVSSEADLEICGEAADEGAAMRLVRQLQPHLVIVDIGLKSGNGVELIKQIRSFDASVRIIVYSMHEEQLYGERTLRAGANGFVNKQDPAQHVLDAIRRILQGKMHFSEELTDRVLKRARGEKDLGLSPVEALSDRELDILRLIGEGRTTSEIAERLHLSTNTVNTYRERLKLKLNLNTGAELTRWATQWVLEGS